MSSPSSLPVPINCAVSYVVFIAVVSLIEMNYLGPDF